MRMERCIIGDDGLSVGYQLSAPWMVVDCYSGGNQDTVLEAIRKVVGDSARGKKIDLELELELELELSI